MKIINLTVTKPFKYLWLKTVLDVDLSQHCAKCLIGEYNSNIKANIKTIENLEISNDIQYLCGVAQPFIWKNNFHLAFKYSKGNILNYSNNGISIIIEDAEMLPISNKYIDLDDINSTKKTYNTCRNWQFAHYFKKHLK